MPADGDTRTELGVPYVYDGTVMQADRRKLPEQDERIARLERMVEALTGDDVG